MKGGVGVVHEEGLVGVGGLDVGLDTDAHEFRSVVAVVVFGTDVHAVAAEYCQPHAVAGAATSSSAYDGATAQGAHRIAEILGGGERAVVNEQHYRFEVMFPPHYGAHISALVFARRHLHSPRPVGRAIDGGVPVLPGNAVVGEVAHDIVCVAGIAAPVATDVNDEGSGLEEVGIDGIEPCSHTEIVEAGDFQQS